MAPAFIVIVREKRIHTHLRLPPLLTYPCCSIHESPPELVMVFLFARADGNAQPVFHRGKRAEPATIIGAGRIVRVIEIKHHACYVAGRPGTRCRQKIAALDGIEEVATATVALQRAGRIAKWQEKAAAIDVEPVE